MNNYIENFKKNNQICTYLVEIKKDRLDKLNPENDFCNMFLWCVLIIEINGIENIIKGRNIKNLKGMFYGCSSLISIKSNSVWGIGDVEDLSEMFTGCENLVSLSTNMSSWKVKNVKTMKNLFYNCKALENLPDISKWAISNVTKLSRFFYSCEILIILPDISKWDMNKNENIDCMFYNCNKLSKIPDISKWELKENPKNINMCINCSSLTSLPDVQKICDL